MVKLLTRICLTALLAAELVAARPADAHLLPRIDLPQGLTVGVQSIPSNMGVDEVCSSVDVRWQQFTLGLDGGYVASQGSLKRSLMLKLTAAFLTLPGISLGVSCTAAHEPPRTLDSGIFVNGLAADVGLCFSMQQLWQPHPEHEVRMFVDTVLSGALHDDRSFDVGLSTGYEAGIEVDRHVQLMLSNLPNLSQLPPLIGIRAHF